MNDNKYENLKELALAIHKAAMIADIDPKGIAIRLPNDYWLNTLRDFKPNDGFSVYHPESNRNQFEVCNITFYNDRSMPEWMKV